MLASPYPREESNGKRRFAAPVGGAKKCAGQSRNDNPGALAAQMRRFVAGVHFVARLAKAPGLGVASLRVAILQRPVAVQRGLRRGSLVY